MSTTNITVSTAWTQIASNADALLITAVSGYGEICQSTGTPADSLYGHVIGRASAQNAYQISGEIYARAAPSSGSLILALT